MTQRAMTPLAPNVAALRCMRCETDHTDAMQWTCTACGYDRMDVVFKSSALDALKKSAATDWAGAPFTMWRYRDVLPIDDDAPLVPTHVGGTPLVNAPRLATALGVASCTLKDEGRNPSGSLKDRPSALGVTLACSQGAERIVCASTGNAASSTAAAAAAMNLPATIFVPERAPAGKVAQLKVFGADVLRVRADYDTTWELCAEVAAQRPWFNRNCAFNPYLVEGKKTCALEVADQMGPAIADWLIYSVGDGCTIAGAVKGLEQAHATGMIPFVPRVLGVQADGARPLVDAFDAGRTTFTPGAADSVADSIAVGHPRNGEKALRFVARNKGAWVSVSDDAIMDAALMTARLGGIFGEPAAAAATAGVLVARERGIISPSESVCIVVSGNGLKDVETAMKKAGAPMDVDADIDAITAALASL